MIGNTIQSVSHLNNGASLDPLNLARLTANSLWLTNTDPGPSTGPTWISNNITGTLPFTHNYGVAVTFNSSVGETTPSGVTQIQASIAGCASGNCQIIVTAPTLPATYTGYTVYAQDVTNSQSLQQIAGCVNITTSCTFGSIPTTSAPPSTNPIMPAPARALASECPPNVSPFAWVPDVNGNMHSWAYLSEYFNNAGGPPSPGGTVVLCHRTWFTDEKVDPPAGKNAFVVIDHGAGVGTATTNQDRALWVNYLSPINDSATRYAEEGIQSELDFDCNGCNINGSPDAEVTDISANTTTSATTNWATTGYGTNAIQARFFHTGPGVDTAGMTAIYGDFINGTNGGTGVALRGAWSSGTGGGGGYGLELDGPSNTNFSRINYLYLGGNFTPRIGPMNVPIDTSIDQRVHNLPAFMNAPVYLNGIVQEDAFASLPISGAANLTGSLTTTQIANNWGTGILNPVCAGGASTYTYQLVAVDGNGGKAASAVITTNALCVNPLTSGNSITLGLTNTSPLLTVFVQSTRVDVYRTSGPMSTGKIGTFVCNPNPAILGCPAFVDTGLAGDGTTVPTANTTGGVISAGLVKGGSNTVSVASDFTTAASTSLQTITGLTWNLPSTTAGYPFHCMLLYSQATSAVSDTFGIQSATVAPTQINSNGVVTTGAAAVATGTLTALTTTTATNIVTFTPSAITTVWGASIDGFIEEPANSPGNVVNIMVSTSNVGDLITVKRGSYCSILP